MTNKILSFATLALLASCAVYRDYERPKDIPTAQLLTGADSLSTDSTSLGSVSWQSFFSDPALQPLIEEALNRNIDLRIAGTRIEQAEAQLRAAGLAYLPTLTLTPSLGYTSIGGQSGTFNYQAPALAASWQLDIFGSLRNAKRRNKAMLESSQAAQQAIRSQLIASVARSYYTIVLLDEQLRVSTLTEKLWGENVRTMHALFQAGVGNDAAVSRTEANYATVRSSVLSIKEQIREAEQALNLLLSRPSGAIIRRGLDGWHSPEVIRVGTALALLSSRPDLQVAEAKLKATNYAVAEAQAAFYPQITLSGNAGWVAQGGKAISQPMDFVAAAVASLVQPLFQQGKLRAAHRVALGERKAAELAFVQAILSAGAEVNNHLAKVQLYQEQAKLLAERTKALERSVKATRMLMESGASSYLEVLTAQEALLSAQLAELSNRYNEIGSTIALYQALGGGR